MNKNFISPISDDDFDVYPEISQADIDRSVYRRNFVKLAKTQNINLTLDADIVAWFKRKSGEDGYKALINATLREAITRENGAAQ